MAKTTSLSLDSQWTQGRAAIPSEPSVLLSHLAQLAPSVGLPTPGLLCLFEPPDFGLHDTPLKTR